MPEKDWVLIFRRWLGIAGISPDESIFVQKIDRFFEFGLLLIAIWLPVQWYSEHRHLLNSDVYQITNWIIWFAFVAETTVLTIVTKKKLLYLATNWVNIAIIVLLFPFFWVHLYITTIVRIVRFALMFRFLVPWFEFSTDFLAKNHLGSTILVAVLVTTTSGILLASFDPGIPTAGNGVWWAWQTITTVGYGDFTPKTPLGRVLGIMVMIFGIGLLAVLTANFSAFFMARNQKKMLKPLDNEHLDKMHETLLRLENKIESLEKSLFESKEKKITSSLYEIPAPYLSDNVAQCCEKLTNHTPCVLHHPCQPVPLPDILTEDFQQTLQKASLRCQQLQGIGIAANQLGLPYQFFLIERDPANSRYKTASPNEVYIPLTFYINPLITQVSDECVCLYHACLSCIGADRGLVATYKNIHVEYFNEKAEKISRKLTDWEAIIFQHEYNHLLGRTYLNVATDYITTDALLAKNDGKVPAPRAVMVGENVPVMIPRKWIGVNIESITAISAKPSGNH